MYDADTQQMHLIVQGALAASMVFPMAERELSSSQVALGRAAPDSDNPLGISIAEFRIYDRALDAATLTEVARRGPDRL